MISAGSSTTPRKMASGPLAVIGVIGTTEEGAIDQFDKLVELRSEWERSQQQSFWLHADAAWGGYFLTALRRSPHDTYMNWADRVADASAGAIVRPDPRLPIPTSPFVLSLFRSSTHVSGTLVSKEAITAAIEEERWADALELSRRLPVGVTDVEPERTRPFGEVSDTLRFGHTARVESPESPPIEVHLDANTDLDVLRALDAIAKADSVTVDPHKMGYQPYACGAIAFQQDGVRDFVRQKAPYITRVDERLTRQPLIHLKPIVKDGVDTYQRSVDRRHCSLSKVPAQAHQQQGCGLPRGSSNSTTRAMDDSSQKPGAQRSSWPRGSTSSLRTDTSSARAPTSWLVMGLSSASRSSTSIS